VIAFDGMSGDEARSASEGLAKSQPGVKWLPIAGLDRHTPLIGLQPLPDLASPLRPDDTPGVQQAIYRPISTFHTVPRAAA
jgi:hypothetical protein